MKCNGNMTASVGIIEINNIHERAQSLAIC